MHRERFVLLIEATMLKVKLYTIIILLLTDFLDSGSNKRVVQEVDRLLKKQPDFACAKVR